MRKTTTSCRGVALIVFASAAFAVALANPARADFAMAGGNAQRTGHVLAAGPLSEPIVMWEKALGVRGESNTQPVLDAEGNLYVTAAPVSRKTWTEGATQPQVALISLAPDGAERWRYTWTWDANDPDFQGTWSQLSGPVLTPDGRIVMGFRRGYLRCWNKDTGKLLWERDPSPGIAPVTSTPVVDRAGFVYVHCRDIPTVRKVDAQGNDVWIHRFVDGVAGHTSSPALSTDEKTLYIGRMADGVAYLYAMNTEDGSFKWAWSPEVSGEHSFAWSIPAVDTSGTVYIQDEEYAHLYAVQDLGRVHAGRWSYKRDGRNAPRLMALDDTGIYSSYNQGHPVVFALNRDGTERWSRPLDKGQEISGMLVSPEALYFGVKGTGIVYALNTRSGDVLWTKQVGPAEASFSEGLTLSPEGVLYVPVSTPPAQLSEPRIVALQAPAAAARVPLTRNGAPAIYLALSQNSEAPVLEAAEDFVSAVERATGARIPREPAPGLVPLHIGALGTSEGAPPRLPDLAREAALLKFDADALWVWGGSPLGAQHGIYTLLQDLGFRWIMPGTIGECLPAPGDLSLPAGERVARPDFRYRMLACGSNSPEGAERLALWQRRNRLHAPPVMQGHNLTNTLGRLAPFEQRPDLYALLEGERKATQVCTSNPEAVALIIQSVSEYLDAHPDVEAYSLCPDDNFYFCECDACRALDVGHRDRGGLPSVSDRYQIFLNQVLEGLATTHPDVLVTTYSYNPNHTDPPQQTPVHPNTAVFCAPNVFCSIHGVGDANCPSQQDLYALLQEWRGLTEHLYLFEYDPEPYCGGLPWPLWRAHAGSYPRFKTLGIKGSFVLAQASWAPYFLSYYVAAQMLWDSSQDPEALYSDILQDFFGPAALPMRAYFDTVESEFRKFPDTALWGMQDYPRYFPRTVAEKTGKFLAEATEIEVDERVAQRLKMVGLVHEMFDAYLRIRTGDYPSYAPYKSDMDRFETALRGLSDWSEDFLNATYTRAKTGIAMSERFAREQGFVNRWLLCGPFDNLGMDGHDRVYEPERDLDFSAVYFGKDEAPATWKPNRTPDEVAYVRLSDEYDVTDWVCAYAVCWVKNEGPPMDVEFRVGSNDSVKVFLNDDLLWDHKIERVASVDNDVVPVTLPSGVSTIMLKVGQAGYDWGFFFRIARPGATGLPEGLTVSDVPMRRNVD